MSKRGYLILIYTGGNRKRGIVKILLMKKKERKNISILLFSHGSAGLRG